MQSNRGLGRVVGGVLALVTVAGLAQGQIATNPAYHGTQDHDGLPFFDVRQQADGTLSEAAAVSLNAWRSGDAYAKRVAAVKALANEVPGVAVDEHSIFGTPHFVRSTTAFLSGPSKAGFGDILGSYLDAHRDLFEVGSKELAGYRVARDFDTHGIMHHLTHQQVEGGLEVFGAILRSSFTSRGEIINISSALVPRPAAGWSIPQATLGAESALRAAASAVGAPIVNPVSGVADRGADGVTTWTVGDELDHWTPVTTRRVLFPVSRDELRPAFVVVVPTKGVGHTYSVVVDAVSGKVLWRQNWLVNDTTQPVTYRFYAGDSPAPWSPGPSTPVTTQAPFVSRTLRTVQPAEVSAFSPDGWIADGGTTTTGNNVDAYLDSVSDNAPDTNGRPVSATRVFDSAIAVDANSMPTGAPSTYGMASVAHGFYHANLYHDRLYAMGFDEPAGNFQTNNFGHGGVQGDYVRLEMQDGSGTNNANFATSTDGSTGRCQMYIFTGPTPDRDGGMDQDILYHELTHGTSTRCHEATLSGTQAGGMGEGWSDYYGLSLSAEPGDDFNALYATGGHTTYLLSATFNTNYYFGIRRFPYSTDMTKSPLTYGDIVTVTYDTAIPRSAVIGNTAGEVHNVGEIWCQTLLEARANIGVDEGFAANQTMMQLVLDGMKIAPSNPNFVTERDAILQADLVRYGGQHQAKLWLAFAKRGIGASAVSPTSGATAGVVEAFDVPNRVDFTFPDGIPTQLSPTAVTPMRVHLSPVLLTLTPNTGQMYVSVNGGAFAPSAMTPNGADEYIATLPASSCFNNVRYYFTVGTSVGTQVSPSTAPAAAYGASVYTGTVQAFYWDMETDAGWTVGPNTASTGIWNRMVPQATTAQPGSDTSAAGTMCWVTDGNAGSAVGTFDVDGGYTYLNTPTFDLSGAGDVTIQYQRWYNNNGSATYGDPWLVEISNNNGTTWTPFESVPSGAAAQNSWVLVSRTLSSVGIAGTNQMKMRFKADDTTTASIVEAAVDDMRIFRYTCESGPVCDTIDFNGDSLYPDTADIDDFLSVFSGGPCSTGSCGDIDFNNDGLFPDTSDIDSLLSVFSGGACL
ncbi:MAG: M36 family metallopeptidase [Phycisphaerales bacterium]